MGLLIAALMHAKDFKAGAWRYLYSLHAEIAKRSKPVCQAAEIHLDRFEVTRDED
jgi:hypothetical protein